MGLSVSVAAVIIFVTLILTLVILFDTMVNSFEELYEASESRYELLLARAKSKIEFVNVSYNPLTTLLNLTLINSGSVTLTTENIDVIVNGTLRTDDIIYNQLIDAPASTTLWTPERKLNLRLENIIEPERVTVITAQGILISTSDIYWEL